MKDSHRANVTVLKNEAIALDERAKAELAALEERPIDLTDPDAPEVTDWSTAQRGKFYRPVKQQITGHDHRFGQHPPLHRYQLWQAGSPVDCYGRNDDHGQITLHLDKDVLEWFMKQPGQYQSLINEACREYMHQHDKSRRLR